MSFRLRTLPKPVAREVGGEERSTNGVDAGRWSGHGTAAGLGNTFEQVGWAEGQDLALGMATVGLLSGVIIGIILINWGVRRGKSSVISADNKGTHREQAGLIEHENRTAGSTMTVHPSSMDPLTLHFGLVALAVLIGQLILSALQWVEQAVWADAIEVMAYITHVHVALAGFIAATAIAIMALVWYGVRAGARWAWVAAVVAPSVGLAVALPLHYAGGFRVDWVAHLGPVYAGAAVYVAGALMALAGQKPASTKA